MDRTRQPTRKGFLKRASLSIAGALTLNNLAHTDTPSGKLSSTKCEIETPVVGVQRAKGSVARSTDLQS